MFLSYVMDSQKVVQVVHLEGFVRGGVEQYCVKSIAGIEGLSIESWLVSFSHCVSFIGYCQSLVVYEALGRHWVVRACGS